MRKPVRFDDRLLTVLNQPASDRHDTAVRWRQLVDLVARAGPNSASPVVADALDWTPDERFDAVASVEMVENAARSAGGSTTVKGLSIRSSQRAIAL